MKTTLATLAAAAALALGGCASTPGGGSDGGPGLFGLASSYDSRLQALTENAAAATTTEARLEQADALAALAAEADGKATMAASGEDADARLVWLSIAANAFDQAALMSAGDIERVKTHRMQVLATTTGLDQLCSENLTDPRLGYRCATGTMLGVMNGSETALAEFRAAVASGDLDAARTSAEGYGVAVRQDWPTYQETVAAYPLGEQDLTPISERQIANACAFNAAANSGTPTWLNALRTQAQTGDNAAVFARNAYLHAAADVAGQLALEAPGGVCDGEGERSNRCTGFLANELTLFCNARSAG